MRSLLFLSVSIAIVFISCFPKKKNIVNEKDFASCMRPDLLKDEKERNDAEINFWQQRLVKDTGSYGNMLELAKYELGNFKLTGNFKALHRGDSLMKRSSEKLANTEPGILFSLSQNSITQHQFGRADWYNQKAIKAGGDPYIIHLLQFDTWMELGRYADAQKALNTLKDKSSFDYLIRKAKWEDHQGKQETAIKLMEQAFMKVKDKTKSLYCWALSNLADMYGHAGRIRESYRAYLDVLKKDPGNLYCLKGIAWIAYSHDKNYSQAKRILQYILSQTYMPDLKLILAEIAEAQNNDAEKYQWLHEFICDVNQPEYGGMYNKYLIHIYTEELREYEKAITIAEKEISNRFTPETCDWLAWSYYNSGDKGKAMEYARGYVYKRSFEPETMMHTAFIYADNGENERAKTMLKQCLQSSFELGPIAIAKIKKKLAML